MLKKLRNKMLMMNMISTFCLIIIAFTAIFAITYNNVEHNIDESLLRAFSFHRPMRMPLQEENRQSHQRVLKDMRNFSVFVESDGSVHTDSMFGENSARYESVAKVALSQNKKSGEFSSEGIIWRFKTHEIGNGAKIIALADITAEKDFLIHLVISFMVCAAVLLILIFLISLHFANRAISPVGKAWEKQKQFIADASHELRTPLTAINTNVDVLLSQKDKTIADEEKWLRYIKSEVARLTDLTGNLLFMAKMDNDANMQMSTALLSEIVQAASLNMEAVAFEKGVELGYNIEKEISMLCDGAQITRLCLILLDNAIKYSPKNEKVRIELKKISKENALLCVHNFGEPIAENEHEKIFDRFYRTDKSRSSSGYGLGLAIAKEIVKIHKGKINVKSTSEEGTQFCVNLPVK